RSLLGGIAEKRFQRIAMSLGDGLVCADRDGRVTVWNPGAEAIFGYDAAEMIGEPLDRVCATSGGAAFAIAALAFGQESGGKVMELAGRRKSGEVFPLEASFSRWQGVDGFQYGAVMRDISVRKREAERIRYLAEHDTLTGLPNRNTLYEELRARIGDGGGGGRQVALLVVGLDKFKEINDPLGHGCGDRLLCAVADRLTVLAADTTLVARMGGDEFAIVVSGIDAADQAARLSGRVSFGIGETAFSIDGRAIGIKASIGVAVHPDFGATADELLANADLALYRAKAAGRGSNMFFERRMRDELEARLALEAELALAVKRGELELFFQPQIRLADRRLAGAETLIRWRKPGCGLVSPAMFMPVVHASPIGADVARWVMATA